MYVLVKHMKIQSKYSVNLAEFPPHILHHIGIFREVAEQSREIRNVSRMGLAFFPLESYLQEPTPFLQRLTGPHLC